MGLILIVIDFDIIILMVRTFDEDKVGKRFFVFSLFLKLFAYFFGFFKYFFGFLTK